MKNWIKTTPLLIYDNTVKTAEARKNYWLKQHFKDTNFYWFHNINEKNWSTVDAMLKNCYQDDGPKITCVDKTSGRGLDTRSKLPGRIYCLIRPQTENEAKQILGRTNRC